MVKSRVNNLFLLEVSFGFGRITVWVAQNSQNIENKVPTRTGKPGKMGRHFPVREKSGNFEQTGKVRENHTKYWKN